MDVAKFSWELEEQNYHNKYSTNILKFSQDKVEKLTELKFSVNPYSITLQNLMQELKEEEWRFSFWKTFFRFKKVYMKKKQFTSFPWMNFLGISNRSFLEHGWNIVEIKAGWNIVEIKAF